MCGICGIVNFDNQPVNENLIREMMLHMKYRGPDDEGLYLNDTIGVGFVRLSILDLSSAGHQPMRSEDGRFIIAFNGEIFNYIELRDELSSIGYRFNTQTDTEVLLAAFREWGEKCLDKFNGMWAFVIYDTFKESLFIARDRFGVKPLYYFQSKDLFAFSSEIKPLQTIFKNKLSVDELVVYEYLTYNRTDYTCDTFVKEIKRFEHGYCAFITRDGHFHYKKWYNLSEHIYKPWSSPEEYREMFNSAIDIRLRSDVPIGVCLSGGIDSSSVTSTILNRFGIPDLYTFSAVYGKGKQGDESEYINIYSSLLSNLIFIRPTAETLIEDFDKLMDCHFEPFGDLSIYSQFKVLKDASNYITVGLDGQGADEQLAGYHYFFACHFRGLLRELKIINFLREVFYYYKNHKSITAFLYFLYYSAPNAIKEMSFFSKKKIISDDFYSLNAPKSRINSFLYNPKDLNKFLLIHFENKLEHNLKWNDLNSMYHSIELRVPFLDYRLVERTLATPADKIIKKGTTKWILREAMKGVLPEKIRLRQDKVGFENPADEWFRSKTLQNILQDTVNSSTLRNTNYFNMKEVLKLYQAHQTGKINARKDLWKMIHLNYFLNRL